MGIATMGLQAKIILILGVALGLSLGGNFLLVRKAWMDAGRAEVQGELNDANAKLDAAEDTLALNTALGKQAQKDHSDLLAELAAIAERGQQTRTIIRNANRAAAPLPQNCGPGPVRMEGVNKALAEETIK